MSSLTDRIAQFLKMTTDDPENELGHFRLGQLYMENNQFDEAVRSFERTLELSPQFSKVFQLMGESYSKLGNTAKAIEVFTRGHAVANERGDKMPRDAMALHLAKLGVNVTANAAPVVDDGPETGFRCQRPGCAYGKRAKPLAAPPVQGEIGERIAREICMDCWNDWLKNYSIKVVNELRLDLSSEFGQAEYDKHLRGFMGFEDSP
jgi:tetratricopeptide (TPR) repeat protein